MSKESLINTAALIAFVNYLWYSWDIWRQKTPPLNIAGWSMGLINSAILLGCSIAAQKPSLLALSYTLGGSITLILMLIRGVWKWTWVETGSAVTSGIALILWQTLSPDYGAIAGLLALNFGAIPLVKDIWKEPNSGAALMFASMFVAAFITLYASLPWNIHGSLLPASGVVFNAAMFILCTRDNADTEDSEEFVDGND